MAQDYLDAGIFVEDAAQDQPDALGRRFHGKAPGGGQQGGVILQIIFVVNVGDILMGNRRVDIKRHV